ncbi:MAG: mechanosensitive ion channel [Streptosporangiales bacterium]|nr:mechanosensitive ion channel [Streptosporangiales bacterium]
MTVTFAQAHPWYVQLIAIVVTLVAAMALRFLLGRLITRIARRIGESRMPQWRLFPGRSSALLSERREQRTQTAASLLRSVTSFVVFSIAVVLVLYYLGVELTKVFAGVGVISLIVGFGAREIISDFLAGIAMLGADQYGVGDVVDVGAITGTVEGVGLRTTRLRDADGAVWYVRNGQIPRVGNMSQGWGRAVIDVPVPSGRDPDTIRDLLGKVARSMRDEPEWQSVILDEPDVPGVVELETDHYVVQVTVRTSPLRAAEVAADLRERFVDALDDALAAETPPATAYEAAEEPGDRDAP